MIMEKVLKKYTTIPEHLYVSRNADIQLERIIDEMQRPGYVLVARQMGKTNLLFNAKRKLESQNRLFVYVDLSNLFENERECYSNIIDNIIEPNLEIFNSIQDTLLNLRDKKYAPHKEYSQSLRIILEKFPGDIVIILDEIDALKSVGYSDNIFAQIRSNYFSRTNFPEFERLTYVLSGVIEPTELIKDKNKSPFNIGDKIYLDDFEKEEHYEFIRKSRLKIDEQISEEIFNWTNGNPRLTFDICSELESLLIEKGEINLQNVENLVKLKYLTSYDVAPIDHIRELVKSNKLIRDAIKLIHSGESSKISDEIRKKLYLYGIINSNFDKEIEIKNRIIKFSLSEEWIKSIDKQSLGLLSYGISLYKDKSYPQSIEILKEFLANSTSSQAEIDTSRYYIGYSYYLLRDFNSAIDYLSYDFADQNIRSNARSFLGVCMLAVGKNEGFEILEDCIKLENDEFPYHNALLNLAINLNDRSRSFELLSKLFDSTFKAIDENEEELNGLRTLSLYYQADILIKENKGDEALEKIRSAYQYSSVSNSLYLIYLEYVLEDSKNENLKAELIKKIIDGKIKFSSESYPISFNSVHLYLYLGWVFETKDLSLFDQLLIYATENLFEEEVTKFEIIYESILLNPLNKLDILNYLFGFKGEISKSLLSKIYMELAYEFRDSESSFFDYFNEYVNLFIEEDFVGENDLYLFAYAIRFYHDQNKYNAGLSLCNIIDRKLRDKNDEELAFTSLIIYYWYSVLYFDLKNREEAIKYAKETTLKIELSKIKYNTFIDEEGLKSISNQLNQIIKSLTSGSPKVVIKKYGRNEVVKVRYTNGSVIKNKFKYVEDDILALKCEIID